MDGKLRTSRVLVWAGVLAWTASRAAAQAAAQGQRLVPPKNESGIEGHPWLTGFAMVVVLALVLVGAFLKAKRGHQD